MARSRDHSRSSGHQERGNGRIEVNGGDTRGAPPRRGRGGEQTSGSRVGRANEAVSGRGKEAMATCGGVGGVGINDDPFN